MSPGSRLARWIVIIGGSLGILVVSAVGAGQLNLGDVLWGRMPLSVAIALGANAFAFLGLVLLICLIALLGAGRNKSQLWAGLIWLGAAGILAVSIYYSRFSIGPLLIPTTALFATAGLLALAHGRR